jgi:membrane protease YdiL (CAAX protease family)
LSDILTFIVAPALGIIAIVVWVRRGQPVIANLGFKVTRWTTPDLLVGIAITAAAILGVFLVELSLGVITVTAAPYDLNAFVATFADIAANAAIEEIFFRSLPLSGLVVVLGFFPWGKNRWIPVLLSAVLFGLIHATNPGASVISVIGNALGGLIYGMAFLGARNIWFPFGLHLGWNFTQTLLGFPVSGKEFPGPLTTTSTGSDLVTGGDFGPEAGIIGILSRFVVIALLVGYLKLRYRDGSFAALRYAPDPQKRKKKITRENDVQASTEASSPASPTPTTGSA